MELSANNRINKKTHKRRKTWIAISILIIVVVVIVIVILGFTLFKPKHTVTTINSVKLDSFDVSLDVLRLNVDLNITLDLDISVRNPNRVDFKYGNGSALLYHREVVVGEAMIPAGEIHSREKMETNVTLTVMADRVLSDSSVYSDVISGVLPLKTYTRISGRVTVLKLFKHHLVSYTYCDLVIAVRNRTLTKSDCKYRTKL